MNVELIKEEIKFWGGVLGGLIALLAFLFSVNQSVRASRAETKNLMLNSYLHWQSAAHQINCYYEAVENKENLPSDINDSYPILLSKFDESVADLEKAVKKANGWGFSTLSRTNDGRVSYEYKLVVAYSRDLMTIKKHLNQKDLDWLSSVCINTI